MFHSFVLFRLFSRLLHLAYFSRYRFANFSQLPKQLRNVATLISNRNIEWMVVIQFIKFYQNPGYSAKVTEMVSKQKQTVHNAIQTFGNCFEWCWNGKYTFSSKITTRNGISNNQTLKVLYLPGKFRVDTDKRVVWWWTVSGVSVTCGGCDLFFVCSVYSVMHEWFSFLIHVFTHKLTHLYCLIYHGKGLVQNSV